MPSIRRVAQLQNYHDGEGEEDKEELLNFKADELLGDADEEGEDDQWVATHISSKGNLFAYTMSDTIDVH